MKNSRTKFELAQARVKEIKGFFRHLKIFILVNGTLYLFKSGVLRSLLPDWFPEESYYFDWVDLNVLIWLAILLVHAITLYRHKFAFLKRWEDRQIKKYLDKDKEDHKKYH